MKKGKLAKFGAILAAITLMAGSTSVFAYDNYSTDIDGTKTTAFDKYLVMNADANVPNATFTYEITAGESKAATSSSAEILSGVDADKIIMPGVDDNANFTIAYHTGDATLRDNNALVKNYDKATQKYAKKTATLDFSQCAFTEPGIYRYILTESGTNQGITNDTAATRVIDVYVEDATVDTLKLKVAGIVLHATADGTNDSKSQGFTNVYSTANLTVGNKVTGNRGSHNKSFEYTISITDAVPGTTYWIDSSNTDQTVAANATTKAEYGGEHNPLAATVDTEGKATITVYLQDGQEVIIKGISAGTKYDVSIDGEDYMTSQSTSRTDVLSGTMSDTNLNTGYEANRADDIPTDDIMSVAPFAIIALIGIAGMVILQVKKRKSGNV